MMFDFVVNNNAGLGDCLSCFNTDKKIWSPSPHFQTLRKYSSLESLDAPSGYGLDVCSLSHVAYPNHHLFNRVRIASGLEPLEKPRAILDLINYVPIKTNVAFSFDVGSFAPHQTFLHPRPRQLYDEHRATIQEFFTLHSKTYNFIEVGTKSFGFNDTVDMTGVGLDKTIEILASCNRYFGMHSGMMHLATAIGLKCTIVINFPTIEKIESADTQDINDQMDWEKAWLYPQHDYLHEDVSDGDFYISLENLKSTILST